jgi:hypothetical protein
VFNTTSADIETRPLPGIHPPCKVLITLKDKIVVRSSDRKNQARHGMPVLVVSENGAQFASAEFGQFTSEWEFHHVTSSQG